MKPLETLSQRYLEPSEPERFYRYPTRNVITDPLVPTTLAGVSLLVNKALLHSETVQDASEVGLFVFGITTLLGGWTYTTARSLDVVERERRVDQQLIVDREE